MPRLVWKQWRDAPRTKRTVFFHGVCLLKTDRAIYFLFCAELIHALPIFPPRRGSGQLRQ
jgi:hypothetical protein